MSRFRQAVCLALLLFFISPVFADTFNQREDVQQFIHGMVLKHHFDEEKLEDVFSRVQSNEKVLKLISTPAEKKPWYVYRKLFISQARIKEGVTFWRDHSRVLQEAEDEYGVPASIIVAIIGIETSYGDSPGNIRTLDALSTLAFDYPPRAQFFRGELEQFLLLTRELSQDPTTIYGSYAGAMGYAQFMPSSYRKYAVDFNHNKRADLLKDPVDAIGSVANYLKVKGWQKQQAICVSAKLKGTTGARLPDKANVTKTLKEWAHYGVYPVVTYPADKKAGFLRLEDEQSPEYWLVFRNFYVIKAYNSSSLYAMAVYQLSQALKQQRRLP